MTSPRRRSDWESDEPTYAKRAPLHHERADGTAEPYFFGSSLDFEDLLRGEHRDLHAPEGQIVPLDGQVGWDPSFEEPAAEKCPLCLTGFAVRKGPILEEPAALFQVGYELDEQDRPRPLPDTHPVGCPYCRERIAAGSLTYCPKCRASGFEQQLDGQRELAGTPPLEPKQFPAIATRKDRRKQQRAARARSPVRW